MNDVLQLALVFVVAFVVTYLMVPISKRIALRIGAIDYPSNRRINTVPIPRCGGIALYVGFMASLLCLYLIARQTGHGLSDFMLIDSVNPWMLVAGITIMFAVGLVDDVTQLKAPIKFAGQIASCLVVYLSGVSITAIVAPVLEVPVFLGWLDAPITIFYLLVFVNVTNLIDGLDGLAAGLVTITAAALLVLVSARGGFMLPAMCLGIIGACLAFLRFNFHPATVFMGDSGALFLGLMVGITSIMGVVRTQGLVLMLVPLVIAGVPVIDTISAIVRRLLAHQRIDQADMGHLHHRLVDAGLNQRRAVLVLYACAIVLAVAGVAAGQLTGAGRYVVLVALGAVLAVVIWRFRLFRPVLQHHYDNSGKIGPRMPAGYGAHAEPIAVRGRHAASPSSDASEGAHKRE